MVIFGNTLYTIKPSDIVKFESTDYIPVPSDWETSSDNAAVRDNAVDGSIKIVTISNAGVGIGTADAVYTKVPIKGNGSGAECTVTINSSSQVSDVTVSTQGSGYTYGSVDLVAGGVPTGTTRTSIRCYYSTSRGHGKTL